MDGKLARGYTRQSLRRFEETYPAALKDLSLHILPYFQALYGTGKLSRCQAREAVAAFGRHIVTQPHVIWTERFADTRHSPLSRRFGEGLHCIRLNLAHRRRGDAALVVHADLMRAERNRIEFRATDLPIQITDHALARLLERGQDRIADVARGLAPYLWMATLLGSGHVSRPRPIVVPHRHGLFLGRCEDQEGYAWWSSVLSRTLDETGERDVRFPPCGAGKDGSGPTITLSTFIGEIEMTEGQRRLRERLCKLAEGFSSVLLDVALTDSLYRPTGEILGAITGREIQAARQEALQRDLHALLDSPLWREVVDGPRRTAKVLAPQGVHA